MLVTLSPMVLSNNPVEEAAPSAISLPFPHTTAANAQKNSPMTPFPIPEMTPINYVSKILVLKVFMPWNGPSPMVLL